MYIFLESSHPHSHFLSPFLDGIAMDPQHWSRVTVHVRLRRMWSILPKTFLLSAKLQPTSRPDCVSQRRISSSTTRSHGRPRNLSRKCAIGRRCRLGDSWLVEIVLPWAISRPLWGLDICSPWLHQESHVLIAISALCLMTYQARPAFRHMTNSRSLLKILNSNSQL